MSGPPLFVYGALLCPEMGPVRLIAGPLGGKNFGLPAGHWAPLGPA